MSTRSQDLRAPDIRLAGERCVEVYEPKKPVRVVRPGSERHAPEVLANPVLTAAESARLRARAMADRGRDGDEGV